MEYGLIGKKLGHSYSVEVHKEIGNYNYILKEIPEEDLDAFMTARAFKGINVTIPYKQSVIPYLDYMDEAATKIGAVNTIVNKDGKLYGYNTDFIGLSHVISSLGLKLEGKKVLILGSGGTSKTAQAVAESMGAKSIFVVSRKSNSTTSGQKIQTISYQDALTTQSNAQIIINTTPCGMYPNLDQSPISLENFKNLEGLVDAIYNPLRSMLVLDAQARGIPACGGLAMLIQQAIAAAQHFLGRPIEDSRAEKIYQKILISKQNIVLTGMPGSGKTTIGTRLAALTGRPLIDTDQEIQKIAGRHPSAIIRDSGEDAFRTLESSVCTSLASTTGAIIATGGGSILRDANVRHLKANGLLLFLDRRPAAILPTSDRPLSSTRAQLDALYTARLPRYISTCDLHINADTTITCILSTILATLSLPTIPSTNTLTFQPSRAISSVSAPPSKSMAHRHIICSALAALTLAAKESSDLATTKSTISNIDLSEDIKATLDCITALGCTTTINGTTLEISASSHNINPNPTFKCRESGSTLRFFIPIALVLCKTSHFEGSSVLLSRPLSVYEDICRQQGIAFKKIKTQDTALSNSTNLNTIAIEIFGNLTPGTFQIPGNISSQFITGLLFALPLLSQDSSIELTGQIESRPYIDMTIQVLNVFGITIKWSDKRTLQVPGNQHYQACISTVEGDYSNAAFLDAFNTIGGDVTVTGLKEDSLQGDKVYKTLYPELQSGFCEIDISDCPDLGPVLMSVAAANHGALFTGTKRLKIKESDRGTVMCQELYKFGISTEMTENTILVKHGPLKKPTVAVLSHNDHRIAMAMSILLSITGGTLDGAFAVRKSYPSYFDQLKALGINIQNTTSCV